MEEERTEKVNFWGFGLTSDESPGNFAGRPLLNVGPVSVTKIWYLLMPLIGLIIAFLSDHLSSQFFRSLAYTTTWGEYFCILAFILQLYHVVFYRKRSSEESELLIESNSHRKQTLTLGEKFFWLLMNGASGGELFIVLLFWAYLFPYTELPRHPGLELFSAEGFKVILVSFRAHGPLALLFLLDLLFFSRRPMRWQHFTHPMLFGTCYSIFNLVYFLGGGRSFVSESSEENLGQGNSYIYPFLNWEENPTVAVIGCLLAIVSSGVCHFIWYGIHQLGQMLRCRNA